MHLYSSVAEYIKSLPAGEKKLVFFNSINQAKTLAKAGLKFDMMSAEGSKRDVEENKLHYRVFDGTLGNVTLATSAYYQACDIHERAHVIFVVNMPHAPHTMLTVNQIIQALGRCRKGVLSATLIFRPTRNAVSRGWEDIEKEVTAEADSKLASSSIELSGLYSQQRNP